MVTNVTAVGSLSELKVNYYCDFGRFWSFQPAIVAGEPVCDVFIDQFS